MYYLDSDGSIYHFKKSGDTYVCKETKDLTLNDGSVKTPSGDTVASVKSTQIGEMSYSYKETIAEENIVKNRKHAYTIKDKKGVLYRFNKEGQLVAALDPDGTFLLYEYYADGRLKRVSSDALKTIELSYQKDSGLLEEITLPDETKLCYTYSNGRLTEMSHCSKDGKALVSYAYG